MTRAFAGDAWRVELPESFVGRQVDGPPETDTMAIARGWLSGDAPCTVIVSTRSRTGRTLRSEARRLSEPMTDGPSEGREVAVPGAHGARRVDGHWIFEEALSEEGHELLTVVVAARRRDFVYLTVRTRRDDDVTAEREAIVASFEVLGA